jgi:cystathionine beta-lyase/cystathionine gamma-synthase
MPPFDPGPHHPETRFIHGKARSEKWEYDHHVIPPKTASTTFRLDSAVRGKQGFVDFSDPAAAAKALNPIYIYDRLDEPTVGMLEDQYKDAEGGEMACAFACGMAAISAAILVSSRAGSNLIAHRTLYGCTFSLMTNWLPRYGITTQFVNASNLDELVSRIDAQTRLVYIETPANPTLECLDIAAIKAALAPINAGRGPKDQVVLIVDNTFASPWAQRPLAFGADLVVASLTKNVGGFGVDMGGIVVAPHRFSKGLRGYRKDFGGVLPPATAWGLLVYGLSTLPIRLARQCESAARVARFLEGHPKIGRVFYPSLASFPWAEIARRQLVDPEGRFCPGHMVYFELAGDLDTSRLRCERMIDSVAENAYSVTLAVSLGMTKTLIEAPGLMTHSALDACAQSAAGIHPGGVRLSLGLENVEDVLADLAAGLDNA